MESPRDRHVWSIPARAVALFALLFMVAFPGCKEDPSLNPPPLGVTPEFAPTAPTVSDSYVSLQESEVDGQHITLDVVVTDVDKPISGIAIKLSFPGDIAYFDGCMDGNLLPPGNCIVSPTPLQSNELFVGRTIINPDQPVPAVGSQTIVRLRFLVFGTISGASEPNLVFEATNLGGGDATALLDVNGDPILVNWYSGSLSGTQ